MYFYRKIVMFITIMLTLKIKHNATLIIVS